MKEERMEWYSISVKLKILHFLLNLFIKFKWLNQYLGIGNRTYNKVLVNGVADFLLILFLIFVRVHFKNHKINQNCSFCTHIFHIEKFLSVFMWLAWWFKIFFLFSFQTKQLQYWELFRLTIRSQKNIEIIRNIFMHSM